MIAALMLAGALELSAFETIRRITFVVIGIAPVAFLIALLDARLARSAVGDLVVELDADPAPTDLRDALSRALGDPSLTIAYWLPEFESWADFDGRAVVLPAHDNGRATTLIDREGYTWRRSCTTRRLAMSPSASMPSARRLESRSRTDGFMST